MSGYHDVRLVALSIAVAILASYTALELAGRVTAARRGGGVGWLGAGAVAMGAGIWSMHFLAMLAFHLPVPITYDVPLALLSVLAAIAASALALFLVSRERLGTGTLLLGGICMGGGVGAMHYTGMAAIRAAAQVSYDGVLVAASLVIAVTASVAALWLAFQVRHDHTRHRLQLRTGAAVAMGLAIAGMHYTAMAAAHFTTISDPSVGLAPSGVLASGGLAVAVVLATLLILGLALVASVMDRAIDAKNIELERLAAIVESSDDAIVSTTTDGTILTWNSGAERLFGHAAAEALGQPCWIVVPPEDRAGVSQILGEIAGGGRIENREVVRTRKDGTSITVSLAESPIRNPDGVITGVSSIARDVTAQNRMQEAERFARGAAEAANKAKSDFLANMSHEIRTPMNGVMGMLYLALDTELTTEQREYLEIAKTATDALLAIINDILDFSKIEAGKLDLDPVGFQLGDSFADMLAPLTLRAHAKKLELVLDIAPDLPDELVGDVGRLRQIVVNLVGNALKFTERGEVVVRLGLESATENVLMLHCSVADTGSGIPPEKQSMVFDSFAQADMSSTREHGGTGLGLAISSRIASLMGGRIWLESQVGRGSTFHFTFRVERASEHAVPGQPRPVELSGVRTLVVDDNATNRRILSGFLTRWEAVPVAVDGGPAALIELDRALIAGRPFPLILLDAQMPEMDGFTLAEQIFARPGLQTATVMMLSSAGQRGDAARCRKLGISAYLTKPIRPSELLQAIGIAVQGRVEPQGAHLVTRHSVRTSTSDDGSTLKILVAEDNPVNQQLAVRLLQKRGHTVVVAQDGQEALQALEQDRFDLVLMDVQMPKMGGLEATALIRDRERGTGKRIPIVAMTARAMKGDREACLAAGMDGYVAKPISPQSLFDQIAALTTGRVKTVPEPALSVPDLLARLDGDHVLLHELATIFLSDYPARLAAIRSAVEQRDAGALQTAAHSLKGSAANFGAPEAVSAAERLECMGRRGDLDGVKDAFTDLTVRMTQLTGEMAGLCRSGPQ
jgi:two-component system sensor histidine kinase/response regulator